MGLTGPVGFGSHDFGIIYCDLGRFSIVEFIIDYVGFFFSWISLVLDTIEFL